MAELCYSLSGGTFTVREKFDMLIRAGWALCLDDPDGCKFYTRYYYSNANTEELRNKCKLTSIVFHSAVSDMFVKDTDICEVMHRLFVFFHCNVMDVLLGFISDTEENRVRIFNILFDIFSPFLKSE